MFEWSPKDLLIYIIGTFVAICAKVLMEIGVSKEHGFAPFAISFVFATIFRSLAFSFIIGALVFARTSSVRYTLAASGAGIFAGVSGLIAIKESVTNAVPKIIDGIVGLLSKKDK